MDLASLTPIVNGQPWVIGDELAVMEPATGAELCKVPNVGPEGVNAAVAAAVAAKPGWAATPPKDRAAMLSELADAVIKNADAFAELESRDVGKPLAKARGEMISAADKYRFFGGACRTLTVPSSDEYKPGITSFVRREPVGVVAAIAPWNYPMGLTAWKIAPALAAGNPVVLKPTEVTPLTAMLLGQFASAILPPGVLNVVTGSGATTGAALVRHRDVAMVSLTGGTATGRAVMREAADSIKKVHLELGGKAPVLVFEDADLDLLCQTLKAASFGNSGQDCTAACRVYVERSRYSAVVDMLVETAKSIKVGNGFTDTAAEMGPVVSSKHRAYVSGFVERARSSGYARVVAGGKEEGPGFYYLPTVVADVQHADEIVQEEIFGPVIAVSSFSNEDEAVAKANDINYGLAASVWSKDVGRAISAACRIEAGTVWINDHGPTMTEMPFGGYKQSGIGRDLSIYAVEAHTQLKHVAVTHRKSI